jgi:predicted HTH domain antitoxin
VSNPELARLRALAAVITTAEATLDVAYRSLHESATALLQSGEATLAEVSEASGREQGELLELLSRSTPGREPSWKRP